MKADMQVGKLYVTLNLLKCKNNDIPNGKKGKELGQVYAVSANYELNSIPTVSAIIPLGSKIKQSGELSPSYAYGGKKDSLMTLADKKTPVGVYVKGTFFDTKGGSSVQEYCILKGFITGGNFERSFISASLQISLVHWLSDLTTFPMVSSLLSPQTSADVAAQYPLAVSQKEQERLGKPTSVQGGGTSFCPVGTAVDMLRSDNSSIGIWDALKAMFLGICPNLDELDETEPGYVSKDFLERAENALKAIIGKDLDFLDETENYFGEIKYSIAQMLLSLSCGYFNGSTIWDKLVSTFLPNFYMALVPRVNEVNIIPAPGQNMWVFESTQISCSEYYQTSYSRNRLPLLGGVLLYMDPNVYKGIDNCAKCSIRYPEELQPGPLRVVTAPSWLQKDIVSNSGTNIANVANFYAQYAEDRDKIKEAKKKEEEKKEEYHNTVEHILDNLVRITYQILVCSERQLSITMPLRLDITPGELVRIELPAGVTEKETGYIYGTVVKVGLNISTGNATTSIVLSNVRTMEEMDNKEITSSEGIMFKGAWKSDSKLTLCEEV